MESLTEEEFECIVWGYHRNFKDVTNKIVADRSRWPTWAVHYEKIIECDASGDFYRIVWREDPTESLERVTSMTKVHQKEVTTTIYTTDAVVTA